MDSQQLPAVFLVGSPRSGTTWLQRLLAAHPAVRTGPESFVFSSYIGPQLQAWQSERTWNKAQPRLWMRQAGLSTYLTDEQFMTALRAYFGALLEPVLHDLRPGQIFLEKSPPHATYLAEIKMLLPSARIIHLLRDPRDVCASYRSAGRSWAPVWRKYRSPDIAAQWVKTVAAVRSAQGSIATADFAEVRYEDLAAAPCQQLASLADFLGLSWTPQAIAAAVRANRAEVLRAGLGTPIPYPADACPGGQWTSEPEGFVDQARSGRWMDALSPLDKATIWRVAGRVMRREGYHWRWEQWF